MRSAPLARNMHRMTEDASDRAAMGPDVPGEDGTGSRANADGAAVQAPVSPPSPRPISRARWIFVNSLIGVSTVLLVVGMFAIWANRLLFSADNWSNTSTQLLENDAIRATTANYIVDQLYANVDVAGVLRSGLPPRFQPLAGPAAGALRNVAV